MSRHLKCIPAIGGMMMIFLVAVMSARATDTDDLDLFTKDAQISLWDESFSIRTGLGYKDNVLLDDTRERGSPFFVDGLDITIFRLPVDVWEYYFFVTGDDVRYWRDVGVNSEDLWLGAAKIQRDFGDAWRAGITVFYAYQAQVIDLLTSEGLSSHAPAKVIGNTIIGRPFVRRTLGTNYWVELQGEGARQFYGAPAFSYWRAGPKIILGRDYGRQSDISLGYAIVDQPFDTEHQAALDGSSLPGTRLDYLTQKVELTWRRHWANKRAWATSTRLDFDSNRDNGTGYFDYYRYGFSEELDYASRDWKMTATAGFQRYDYPLQTADYPALEKVNEMGLTLNLHIERNLTRWLKVFMEYEYGRSFSNDSIEQYAVNTIKGGALWEF